MATTESRVAQATAIELAGLRFGYGRGPLVLDVEHFEMAVGERVFLYGPSGSGKTTLLGIVAGVMRADEGRVRLLGTDLSALSGAKRDAFRALHIGYIFQMFNLIPYLSVVENITLPVRLQPARRARLNGEAPESAAQRLIERLDLRAHASKKVTELSVGQQQRVAAARALIGAPEIVIADEPTSSLDANRREDFLRLLFATTQEAGSTLLFVSHDERLAETFDRSVSLLDINRAAAPEA
jgi:putative ABC transport system ATP-binding protein